MFVFNGGFLAVVSTGVNESLPLEIADLEGNQISSFQDAVFLCISGVNHSCRQNTYIHLRILYLVWVLLLKCLGYRGCSSWAAFPPTVLLRRTNAAFGVYFVWQHLG